MRFSLRDLLLTVTAALLLGCAGETEQASKQPEPSDAKENKEQAAKLPAFDEPRVRSYESPEAVFKAHVSAMKRGDWETAFACLTESAQDAEIFALYYLAELEGSDISKRHVDEVRAQELIGKGKQLSDQQVMKAVVESLKDKRAFYLEASQEFAKTQKAQAPQGELRNVKVSGNTAVGVTTEYFEVIESEPGKKQLVKDPYEQEIRFSKGKNGWRIDAKSPSSQESP